MTASNGKSWRSSYRNLLVWQRSMQLGVEVNRLARSLPPHERFELARQMRTAVFAIAANIAEGKGRVSRADFARFLSMARGSANELNTCFDFARMLRYLSDIELETAENLPDQVGRMLTRMMRTLAPLQDAKQKTSLRPKA